MKSVVIIQNSKVITDSIYRVSVQADVRLEQYVVYTACEMRSQPAVGV